MTITNDGTRKLIGQAVLRPRQQVEETIKAAILSGELESGEMLPPEAELARQFNVSRTTLREALRVLTSQHLITKIPGARGGNFVRSVDYHALGTVMIETVGNLLALGGVRFDEVADVRQHLEVPSVRLARSGSTGSPCGIVRQRPLLAMTAGRSWPLVPARVGRTGGRDGCPPRHCNSGRLEPRRLRLQPSSQLQQDPTEPQG